MKAATVNFKTDEQTKQKAQEVASKLGIPLSNLLNAYLYELAETGSVHFTVAEPMTEQMEQLIAAAEADIKRQKHAPSPGTKPERETDPVSCRLASSHSIVSG